MNEGPKRRSYELPDKPHDTDASIIDRVSNVITARAESVELQSAKRQAHKVLLSCVGTGYSRRDEPVQENGERFESGSVPKKQRHKQEVVVLDHFVDLPRTRALFFIL